VDAGFAAFGQPGTYHHAAGGASAVSVILDRPDEDVALAGLGVSAPLRIADVRVSELAQAPAPSGDSLTVAGERRRVKKPQLDDQGLVWRLDLGEVVGP